MFSFGLNINTKTPLLVFLKIYGIFLVSAVVIKYILRSPPSDRLPEPQGTVAHTRMAVGAPLEETFASAETDGGVSFIDAKTTATFLLHDDDGYVKNMSKSDLAARKVVCQEAYRLRAYYAAQDFTDDQKALLRKGTAEADAFFRRYNGQATTGRGGVPTAISAIAYFDAARAAALPWKLMHTTNEYEEGLPHTRGEYIFISPATLAESYLDFVETLIHEKIHIYQRRYAREKVYVAALKQEVFLTEYMVSQMGYTKSKRRSEAACDLRANPDLDDWIYKDPKTGAELFLCYRSAQPTGITDVIGDAKNEHPFEWIAYKISQLYKDSR